MFQKPIFGRKGVFAAVQQVADFVSSSEQPDLGGLTEELRRLELFGPGFGRKACNYVATGEPVGFAEKLAAFAKSADRYKCDYFRDTSARVIAQVEANMALARGEVSDPAVAVRFVALRRAVEPTNYGKTWSRDAFPESQWLAHQMFEMLMAGAYKVNEEWYKRPNKEVYPTLSPRQTLTMLRQAGGDVTLYFELIGPRAGEFPVAETSASSHPELATLIAEHPREFAESIKRQWDEKALMQCLRLAGHLDSLALPAVLEGVLSLLGKGKSKVVREAAISTLARLKQTVLPQILEIGLAEGELEMRYDLVQIAGRNGEEYVLDALRNHLPSERSGKVKGAIEATLQGAAVELVVPIEPCAAGAVALSDGTLLELSALDKSLLALPDENDWRTFYRLVEFVNARRAAVLAAGKERSLHQVERLQPITDADAQSLYTYLCEETARPEFKAHLFLSHDFHPQAVTEEMRRWCSEAPESLCWRTLLWLHPIRSIARLVDPGYFERSTVNELFHEKLGKGADIHALAMLAAMANVAAGALPKDADTTSGNPVAAIREWLKADPRRYIEERWKNPLAQLPIEQAHALIAAGLPALDEALGLAPEPHPMSRERTYSMLALLPAVPERYVPKLFEISLTANRDERAGAQALLENALGLDKRLDDALDDRRQEVRAHAATWLADLQAKSSEKVLRKRLKKEKAEAVRAALIEALLRLGVDLSDIIGPAALVAEAKKAGGKLELPEWLTADLLPAVRFADGSTAPRTLVEYWVALAVKLKDPGNTGLFGIYLDQLLPEDAKTLSGRILQGWIDYDTYGPSEEEANAYAQAQVDAILQRRARNIAAGTFVHVGAPLEVQQAERFAYYKREKLNERPNTGTKSKGILALACRADPAFAAERVRWFLKKHGRRSHQAMALLDMLAGMNSPTAMQVIIAAATRLKQKSTMAHANAIADRYAKDRGWSYDELADRTVPTAGFDDDGVLDLPCGEDGKEYLARIDASLAIHLYNPAGKLVKALPTGDDEDTRDSKMALSAAKKELKQIVAMQTDRLREALATERNWSVADWLEAFHGHPVMRRLIERLVWQGLDADGTPQGLFRPTQEGDFTDAADEAVDISGFDMVRLAHAALLDAETSTAWRGHLQDYEIKPLLEQFPVRYAPPGGEAEDATQISDRFGWVGQSLTYRGAAEKLGYSRVMGDGGGCVAYEKNFAAAGLRASIENSGSHAYDENVPVVLKHLSFRKENTWSGVPLAQVPPVLLAMCHADLHAIAARGAFDEDWEKKVQW